MDLFSDLEPPAPSGPKVLTVTELTRGVRSALEGQLGQVWVQGEICNFRRQGSGHQYFALKDDKCQVSCVWFHRPYLALRQVLLTDGMAVQVRGQMTVYEARGQYQIVVDLVQPAGLGLLQAKFEALKQKLSGEGLFDPDRKRALPRFPNSIGIVTSPTGAAIRDMLNILHRRAPWVEIVINPVRVQGEGAAAEMAAAVVELNAFAKNGLPPVDAIVVARGGGSAEDLWAFNEEILARAIFASDIPVMSAVGHEIDFTIADFVADVRAPTPSAAAELIAPDSVELARHFAQIGVRLRRCTHAAIETNRARLSFLARGSLVREPAQRLAQGQQWLDGMAEALGRSAESRVTVAKQRIEVLSAALERHQPKHVLRLHQQGLAALMKNMRGSLGVAFTSQRQRLRETEGMLRLLSPQATLERGYSITLSADGEIVRSARATVAGDELQTRLRDGTLRSVVR